MLNRFILLPILFIFSDVICDNCILQYFSLCIPTKSLTLFVIILFLQILASPLQAGFSDFFCRKKSLMVSIAVSGLSLILVCIGVNYGMGGTVLLCVIAILKGGFGNTIPLAWAALADIKRKRLRFLLALSTSSYATGYLILSLFGLWLGHCDFYKMYLFTLGVLSITLFLCYVYFEDKRDERSFPRIGLKTVFQIGCLEFKSIFNDLKKNSTRLGIISYFLWATFFYIILVLFIHFEPGHNRTILMMMIGYLFGIILLKLCDFVTDQKMIRLGLGLSSIALCVLALIFFTFKTPAMWVIIACFFVCGISNVFLSASIMSLFSKERNEDEQGNGFGLIISADTLGFLGAYLLIGVHRYFGFYILFVFIFSLFLCLLSWLFYLKYEKERQDVQLLFE